VQVLEGESAIARKPRHHGPRPIPKAGGPRATIRADLATSIEQKRGARLGCARQARAREIAYFFSTTELHPRD